MDLLIGAKKMFLPVFALFLITSGDLYGASCRPHGYIPGFGDIGAGSSAITEPGVTLTLTGECDPPLTVTDFSWTNVWNNTISSPGQIGGNGSSVTLSALGENAFTINDGEWPSGGIDVLVMHKPIPHLAEFTAACQVGVPYRMDASQTEDPDLWGVQSLGSSYSYLIGSAINNATGESFTIHGSSSSGSGLIVEPIFPRAGDYTVEVSVLRGVGAWGSQSVAIPPQQIHCDGTPPGFKITVGGKEYLVADCAPNSTDACKSYASSGISSEFLVGDTLELDARGNKPEYQYNWFIRKVNNGIPNGDPVVSQGIQSTFLAPEAGDYQVQLNIKATPDSFGVNIVKLIRVNSSIIASYNSPGPFYMHKELSDGTAQPIFAWS